MLALNKPGTPRHRHQRQDKGDAAMRRRRLANWCLFRLAVGCRARSLRLRLRSPHFSVCLYNLFANRHSSRQGNGPHSVVSWDRRRWSERVSYFYDVFSTLLLRALFLAANDTGTQTSTKVWNTPTLHEHLRPDRTWLQTPAISSWA
jgi:hypothetical protein